MKIAKQEENWVLLDLGDGIYLNVFTLGVRGETNPSGTVELQFAGAASKASAHSFQTGSAGWVEFDADRCGAQLSIHYKPRKRDDSPRP